MNYLNLNLFVKLDIQKRVLLAEDKKSKYSQINLFSDWII